MKRYKEFFLKHGFIETLKRIITKPIRILNKKKYHLIFHNQKKKLFELNDVKTRFQYIYENNFWPSSESVSGPGSELKNTKNIRREIKLLINEYNIKKILDVPCGDYNWMKYLINNNLEYLGGDIVDRLIQENKRKYQAKNIKFLKLDIINNTLPSADLLICRDCLEHLSFSNIKKILNSLKDTNINYFLLTSYETNDQKKGGINIDIKDGDFRPIYLTQSPFNLPKPIAKYLDKDDEHKHNSDLSCYLYLYSKNQFN